MKTMEQTNHKVVSYKAEDIKQATMKSIIKITTFAKDNNYRLTVNGEETVLDPFDLVTKLTKDLENALVLSSKSTKKGLLNRLRGLEKKITIKRANNLIRFITTKLLNQNGLSFDSKYKLITSSKEETIQNARKSWITLRDEAEKALQLYKEAKGNFYKGNKG